MSDAVDRAFEDLRREYLSSMPGRLDELRADAASFRAGSAPAGSSLKSRLHRLAGSGGSYGFVELSRIAREAEQWLSAHPSPDDAAGLDPLLDRLITAIRDAEIGGSGAAGLQVP